MTLQKPMGIVLEENDPKLRGVYVKSLSQGGAAAASGKIQAGDHLVAVQGEVVTGKDLDMVLATVGNAPAEGVQMKFYRGSLGDVINPQVYFDIDIGGDRAGRVTCRLRKDVVPKTAGMLFDSIEYYVMYRDRYIYMNKNCLPSCHSKSDLISP